MVKGHAEYVYDYVAILQVSKQNVERNEKRKLI